MPPGRRVARSSRCRNLETYKSGATTPETIRIEDGSTEVTRGLTVLARQADWRRNAAGRHCAVPIAM
jgi:hypothetical protein